MNLGFKTRIYASVALLISLSLIILGGINVATLKDKMVEALKLQTTQKLESHVSEMETWVQSKVTAIDIATGHFDADLTDTENKTLIKLIAETAQLANVVVSYNDGRTMMSFAADKQFDATRKPWYKEAVTQNRTIITDLSYDAILDSQVINIVSPIRDNGIVVGVLKGVIDLDEVIAQINTMRFAGGAATLTDRNNVFFASDDPNDIGRTPSQVSETFIPMEQAFASQHAGHIEFVYLDIDFDGYFQKIVLSPEMHWTLMVFVDQNTALQEVYETQKSAVLTGFVLFIFSLVAIVVVLNYAYQPLLKLKQAVLDLSDGNGDLTRRLEVKGEDDLAQISTGFNTFTQSLQQMMLNIEQASQSISSNTQQVGMTAKENETMLLTHSTETDQIVTAIEEMSESARSVAESVGQSASISESARKEAVLSLDVVDNAVETVTALVNEVDEMSIRIQSLNTDANKISEVLNVIGEISEQTNLLALNAAIEAARAGEQGRGFAVVADEVRALAARTQTSTTEISDMLDQLLEGTNGVVSSMENTKNTCQTTANKSSEVSGSLNSMSEAVSQIDDLGNQISAATVQQSAVTQEVSKNMLAIREIVEALVESGRQTVEATESLHTSNQDLEKLVANFKLR